MALDTALGLARTPVATELFDNNTINDEQFFKDLTRLKELRSFLIQEAVRVDNPAALQFGPLDELRCSRQGRPPTRAEWEELESRTQVLFACLTEPLRQRFLFGRIPMSVATLPVWLMLLAISALVAAILVTVHTIAANTPPDPGKWSFYMVARFTLPIYLIWIMLLGALGSLAFVGMNALSVQHDITFDITNRKLMWLRITLGALFGVVLTLPFGGFDAFSQFVETLLFHKTVSGFPADKSLGAQGLLLLLPFVLGFSTPLVITILNRFVDSAQAFFGKIGADDARQQNSTPSTALTARGMFKN
jgi:hypothetical protein